MSKKLDLIPKWVMECIRDSSYFDIEFEDQVVGDRDAFMWFWKDYVGTECYAVNLRRTPYEVDRIADYLMSLPSTFSCEIYANQHKELLKRWGWSESEAEEDYYDFYKIIASCISGMHSFFCNPFFCAAE